MQCSFILDQVRKKLNDPSLITWTDDDDLIPALNEAIKALICFRPDAAAHTAMMLLAPGTEQSIPEDGERLLKVIRNKGANGASDAGRAITKGDLLVMDALMPDWHTADGQTTIEEYFYDPLVPGKFYIYPPAPVSPSIGIDISYVRVLPDVEDADDDLPVSSYFVPALMEWMLYSVWSADDEQSPNYGAAQAHARMFFQLLQVKVAADVAANPKAVVRG